MYHVQDFPYEHDDPGLTGLVTDESSALDAGYECGVCLDFGHLDLIGPCPGCRPDDYEEHLVRVAVAQLRRTRVEESGAGEAG